MTMLPYFKAFVVGGLICLVGQYLIDRTGLTSARILTGAVVLGSSSAPSASISR